MVTTGGNYRPTSLTFNGAGSGAAGYNAKDIPVPDLPGIDRTVLEQQFAYEWFDSSNTYALSRNPPFTKGSAGRLLPQFTEDGMPRRILRGFIRRADYDLSDTKSTARLYFMFNPETIERNYVSYLDQGALDPFNTVYQAGNLVPPPSVMDFSFSLMFDRQEEAALDGSHPGVFVDYEYFDLVVRNVVPNYSPGGVSTGGSELPDNGVMMVNPRDITVVFSPNITVQGRPLNARVTFQKFTHRMIPIRMQVDLTMRATYFGPMRDMVEYKAESVLTENSVPWNITQESPFNITNQQIQDNAKLFMEKMKGGDLLTNEQIESLLAGKDLPGSVEQILGTNLAASGGLNESIAEYALTRVQGTTTKYSGDKMNRAALWEWADCSSYIWAIYATHPSKPNAKMGGHWTTLFENRNIGGAIPDTNSMINGIMDRSSPCKLVFQNHETDKNKRIKDITPNLALMMKGDLLFRKAGVVSGHNGKGHVAMVYQNNPDASTVGIIHCGGPYPAPATYQTTKWSYIASDYTDCWRPMLGNPDTPGNREGGG